MIVDSGRFDQGWLGRQTTERLRYEARCEKVARWASASRHKLLLILSQIQVISPVQNPTLPVIAREGVHGEH